MSNDINTNQTTKDVLKPVPRSANSDSTVTNRQNIAAQGGNGLPQQQGQSGQKASPEQMQQVVTQLNQSMQTIQRNLHFSLDEASGQTVIQVVNSQTGETVRQIPSEEALRISRNIQQQLDDSTGIIFETSV